MATREEAQAALDKLGEGPLAGGTALRALILDAGAETTLDDPDEVTSLVLFTSAELPEGMEAPTEEDGIPIRYEVRQMPNIQVIDMSQLLGGDPSDPTSGPDIAALLEGLRRGGPPSTPPSWIEGLPEYTERTDEDLIQAWKDASVEVVVAGDAVFVPHRPCNCGNCYPGLTWRQLFAGLDDPTSETYATYVTNGRELSRDYNVDPAANIRAYVRHRFGTSDGAPNITA